MKRYAIVKNAHTQREAGAYLPDNYKVIHEYESADGWTYVSGEPQAKLNTHTCFVIEGEDVAGWTLDDYVIPRYASGSIYATEIDLSHPIMKDIPEETITEGLRRRRG